ncbi:Per1-like protein [Myxozyma melibiosi]|uniref:Post-GPI attachment to proteins factor 3 n=1 Tax=Myxozyma melibiosi TaxID=54550 RepID=A0ABR1F2M1_9ASCO
MRMKVDLGIVLVVFAVLCGRAAASVGDRLPEFRDCVSRCVASVCETSPQLPLYLTVFAWTCPQNCDYECQRTITAERIAANKEVVQFHGKWPFKRFLGIQEPASVIFSMLNFVPHYRTYKYFTSPLSPPIDDVHAGFYMKKYYVLVTIVGMNAWVWSSVFHCRDFKLTERLDYFSAGITVMTGFYFAVVRVFRLDRPAKKPLRRLLTIACVLSVLSHISYLSFVRFSYTYNMAANVVVGLLQNALWIYFSIKTYFFSEKRETRALVPLFNVLLLSAAMSLELFDFSPFLDTIDAHSLWHAATVLPSFWYYDWMKADAAHETGVKLKL